MRTLAKLLLSARVELGRLHTIPKLIFNGNYRGQLEGVRHSFYDETGAKGPERRIA